MDHRSSGNARGDKPHASRVREGRCERGLTRISASRILHHGLRRKLGPSNPRNGLSRKNYRNSDLLNDLAEYVRRTATRARAAARVVATATAEQKNRWLRRSAELIRTRTAPVIAANVLDLERAPDFGLNSAAIDRLRLTEERLHGVADALEDIIRLSDPIGEVFDSSVRPNGLLVTRVRVPLGVIFFIYESRPNVTVDAAALCVKSGNAVILRGGKEAFHSNRALHELLTEAFSDVALPADAVQFVETTDRNAVGHFLQLHEDIDVTIPRGGKSLIRRVAAEATMPVIKHIDGVCQVYVDRRAD